MQSRFRAIVLALGGMLGIALAAGPALATDEPLARFEDPLCPGVAGLKVDAAEYMVGRIRANAVALGLRLADEARCDPNIVVAFVPDGQAFLETMRRERAYLFDEMESDERTRLMTQPGPARAFLRVVPRSRDGRPIPRRLDLVNPPQTTMWMAHSKIYSAIRNDIYHAMVLFDRDGISGLSLEQLADYATFRALAQALPENPGADGQSILALFDGADAHAEGLTAFDRAYLAELYAGVPNLPAEARLAALEQATRKRLADGE